MPITEEKDSERFTDAVEIENEQLPSILEPMNPNEIATTTPLLNTKILQSLREIDALEEVIEIYFDNVPTLLASIHEAIDSQDAPALRNAAHSLKSTSGTVGAMTLFELCQKLETMGRNGTTTDAPALIEEVEREYGNVKGALEAEKTNAMSDE